MRPSFPLSLVFAVVVLHAATPPQGVRFQGLAKKAAAARDGGHVEEALSLYRRGTVLQAGWVEGWWNLGTLEYDRNAFAPARDAFAHFVKLQPDAAPGWAFRGLCEFELKEYRASLEHMQRALLLGLDQTPPLSKVTRYHAALLLTRSGQFQNALQLFSQLAVQGADDRNTILGTGLAGLRLPLFPADVLAPQEELVYRVGHAVHEGAVRHEAEARKEFDTLIEQNPHAPELHNLLGQLLLTSDPDAAVAEWKKELAISPDNTPSQLQLAFEYLKRGDASAGVPFAREAIRVDPGSFVAHNALGRLLIASGDLPGGIVELEMAKKLAPDSPDTRVELASAYAKAGRSLDAARERAEFLRLKKGQ